MTKQQTDSPRRIVYVWDADYPWDVRTEKVCRTLREAGHDVHIVARNRAWKPTVEELPEGVVHRMAPWRAIGQRLDTQLGFPAFFSPRWFNLIDDTVASVDADLIIVRDLPLCPTAIAVGRLRGVPVILDMAENYPAMIRDTWVAGRHQPLDYLVRNPRAVAAIERFCLPRVAHVLTVVDESSERIIALGVDPSRATVVSNTPSLARADGISAHEAAPCDRLDIVYLGLLEVHRGIMELVDAAAILARDGIDFSVRIIGDGRDAELFHERARRAGLPASTLEFLGRLPYTDALRIVASSNVGVIPHHATEAWNTTIPNKLFDYMSLGLAVVTSDARPCARVVRETGAGTVFHAGDARDFAQALTRMANRSARAAAAEAGTRAITTQYNWEVDAGRLLEVVRRA